MSVKESEACQIYPWSPLFVIISIFVVFVSVQKYLISEVGSHIHFKESPAYYVLRDFNENSSYFETKKKKNNNNQARFA